MAGRPPKLSVVSSGKIGKEKKKKREIAESKIKVNRNLKSPTWLCSEGKKEFRRVVKEAEPLEIFDNLDISILAIYCNAYVNYIKVTKVINDMDYIENKEGELNVNENITELSKTQDRLIKTIMQCSTKLGLAISDRLRLTIPKGEEKDKNPYLKYL